MRETIRPATADDAAAIAALWNVIIREPHVTFTTVEKSADDVAGLIATRTGAGWPFLVADDGAVLGFATYTPFRDGPGYRRTMEHSVNLAAAARGRGIGRALIAALVAEAEAGGIRSLIAAVSAINPDGLAFHRRLGFTEVGRVPDAGWKGGRYIDLVLLQRLIGN
jgi:phosphinothricin acetyltransferase